MVTIGVLSTPITLDSVRRLAESEEWQEIYFNEESPLWDNRAVSMRESWQLLAPTGHVTTAGQCGSAK